MSDVPEAALEIHQVTLTCASLERLLKARGAVGRGLGELVQSVENDLPSELVVKLQTITSMRNRAVHQAEPLGEARMEAFLSAAQDALTYLESAVVEQLVVGDAVPGSLLPLRSAPIARTSEEIHAIRREGAVQIAVPRSPASSSFSPPYGHPARLEADRRAAAAKKSGRPWRPWWYVSWIAGQFAAGLMLLPRHGAQALLPAAVSLAVALVTANARLSFRTKGVVGLCTALATTALLVFGVHVP